jgi:hypothetical protein
MYAAYGAQGGARMRARYAKVEQELEPRYTAKRYAEILGLSPATLIRWEKEGAVRAKQHREKDLRAVKTYSQQDLDLGRTLREVQQEPGGGRLTLRQALVEAKRRRAAAE